MVVICGLSSPHLHWSFLSNCLRMTPVIRQHVVATASPQNDFGKPALMIMHLTLSSMVLFILSAKPFYCGVLLTVLYLVIPSSAQSLLNYSEKYSRLLSVLILLTFFLVCLSVRIFHYLNLTNASSLLFKMYTHTLLE